MSIYYKNIYDALQPLNEIEFYPLDADQETPAPFGIIDVTDITPIDGKATATNSDLVLFSVIMNVESIDELQNLVSKVRYILDRKCPSGFIWCNFESNQITFDTTLRVYIGIVNFMSQQFLEAYTPNYSPLHYNGNHYST